MGFANSYMNVGTITTWSERNVLITTDEFLAPIFPISHVGMTIFEYRSLLFILPLKLVVEFYYNDLR